ncbi:hypothetical protein F5883DRAFT_132558 [Diaporthe sp. PMI_573]|nr:hypothetical protein F5883DRAFT_132558 [Diaporthaceae sp. PMI_573]
MRPQCHAAVEHPFPLWIRRAASDNKAPRRSFPSEAKVPSADAREFLHGWLAGGAFFPLLSVSSLLRTHDLCVRPCPNCFLTAMFQRGMHDFACHRSLPPVCLPVCPSVFRFSSDSRVRGVNFMLPVMIMTATTMVTEYAELKCGVKARRESRRRKGEKKGGDNHMTKSKEQRRGSLTTIYQPGLTPHPLSHAEDVKTVPVISQMCRRVGPSPPPPPSQAMFRHRTHWLLFGARPCPHFLSLHSSSLSGKLGARWYVHVSSRMPYATPIPAGVEGVSVCPCDDVTPSYDGQLARQARTPDAIPRCEV